MSKIIALLIFILNINTVSLYAKAPIFQTNRPDVKPHRIIRTCCSFGTEMKLFSIPGVRLTEITGIGRIGSHHYLGDESEENGIIYSRRGGFIDMGHLRDQADWTAYIYTQLTENKQKEILSLFLGHEGGEKTLTVNLNPTLNNQDLFDLAGKIAYDLSIWHEIATWFGASSIPFIPERYSSFSVEDPYSNALGVIVGILALKSELPYEEAVSQIIAETLKNLDVVANEEETFMAMEAVRDIWWTREKRLPNSRVLLQRQIHVNNCLKPWLVPGWIKPDQQPVEISVPVYSSDGELLNKFYHLDFRLNYKFPFHKIFPERKNRNISQNDFDRLIAQIGYELTERESQFR